MQFLLAAIVFSTIAALAKRATAAALRVPAIVVIGFGPRLGAPDRVPRFVEFRLIVLWLHTRLDRTATLGRAIACSVIGALAVVVVPFTILTVLFSAAGITEPDPGPPMVVGDVGPGSPAAEAGIEPGDTIVSIDGTATPDLDAVRAVVSDRAGDALVVVVERDGRRIELGAVPRSAGDRAILGVQTRDRVREIGMSEAALRSAAAIAGIWLAVADAAMDLARGPPQEGMLYGPIGMERSPARTTSHVAIVALAWAALAPVFMLVVAIVEAILLVRARRAAPAADAA